MTSSSRAKENYLLRNQIATEINDPNSSFSYGRGDRSRLYSQDELLRTVGGFDTDSISLYFDLLTDSSVYAPFAKQVSEILARPFDVIPGDASPEADIAAKFIRDTLDEMGVFSPDSQNSVALLEADSDFNSLNRWFATADITGIAPVELVYGKTKQGLINVNRILAVNPTRITFEQDNKGLIYPKLKIRSKAEQGVYLPPRKFIFHRYWGTPNTSPYGQGLGRQLYWPVRWKRDALSYWMAIIDRHADPAVIGTYENGASSEKVTSFQRQLQNLASNGTMTMPDGFNVDKLDGGSTGVDWVQNIIDYVDKSCALILLGESTTGENIGGSQAREEINNSIRVRRAQELSNRINDTLNRTLVKWITQMNFGDVALPKIVRPFYDSATILEQANQLDLIGIRVKRDFLERATGLEFKELKKKP